MTSRRTPVLVLIAAVLAVLLGGCTGLPSNSPVQARQTVAGEPDQVVEVRPPGPADGASARDIVRGFLRANAYAADDYAVAREFLTGRTADSWDPERRLSINTGERDYVDAMPDATTVSVSARETAVLDGDGHLTQNAAPQSKSSSFTMTKVAGQWRIRTLPKDFGAWMSESDFDITYTAQRIYYAAPAGKTLVPDVRWFPLAGLTTALARAVLRPPPSYLAPVVTAQMPNGTGLRVDAVPVDPVTGVATVDLTSTALSATATQRTALWAQMIATLSLARGVRSVVITVDGTARLETPDLPAAPKDPADVGYRLVEVDRQQLISRSGTVLRWVDPRITVGSTAAATPTGLASLPAIPAQWEQLAASGDGRQLAGVSGDGSLLNRWVDGRSTTLPAFGTALTAPSFADQPAGEVWVAGTALTTAGAQSTPSAATVWFIATAAPTTTAQPQPVELPWLKDGRILALRVAADGTRVALLVRRSSGATQVLLSAIERDASLRPTALTTPLTVGSGLDDVADITWLDDITIGALARDASAAGARHAVTVPVGGLLSELGQTPSEPVTGIRGVGDSTSDAYLTTADGRVLAHEGATWSRMNGLTDLVIPGA